MLIRLIILAFAIFGLLSFLINMKITLDIDASLDELTNDNKDGNDINAAII